MKIIIAFLLVLGFTSCGEKGTIEKEREANCREHMASQYADNYKNLVELDKFLNTVCKRK